MTIYSLPIVLSLIACNPFAPGEITSTEEVTPLLSDQKTTDGVFQNLKYAYTFRDTSIYGQLIDGNFIFVYPDYDQGGAEFSWGRDEEMKTTHGLFRNVQRLDLIWNNIIDSSSNDSYITQASISRGFNLTVTFNASDIARVDGYASLQLGRRNAQDPWKIVRWHDDSNH